VIRSPQDRCECSYVHEAIPYRMACRKDTDSEMGAILAARNLVSSPGAIVRVSGETRNLKNKGVSTFRFWLEKGSDLPLRIEFQARAYLRIILEVDPALNTAHTAVNVTAKERT